VTSGPEPGDPAGPIPPGPRKLSGGQAATLVGAGIGISRLLGLVRHKVFAFFLGSSDAADAFAAAFRIPNMLQNLLGEGVLSASMIPVYGQLKARGDDEGRREVATAVLAMVSLVTSFIVLAGVVFAPQITAIITIGYTGEKLALTTQLVRILFPGAGLLVISAWCLGVLNAHQRYFLSYASAAFWNVAMIATLLYFGARSTEVELVQWLAWGSVAGCFLQMAVQWPAVLRVLGGFRRRWTAHRTDVQKVLRNFVPVFFGRGVTQLSGFVDTMIASLPVLGTGAQVTLNYAQLLYGLPVSLFGMAVSSAELSEMAAVIGREEEVASVLRQRLASGLRRIAFLVIPSAVAFIALGDQLAELVYGGGRFGQEEVRWVWGVLAGASVGLVAGTLGRLAIHGPRLLGLDPKWGVAGITMGAGLAGWVEFALLRRALTRRLGDVDLPGRTLLVLWSAAIGAALLAWGARLVNADAPMLVRTGLVLGIYGMTYLLVTWKAGIPEAVALRARIFRQRTGRRR
jgi:putative peptidoglycan lipid II flippase